MNRTQSGGVRGPVTAGLWILALLPATLLPAQQLPAGTAKATLVKVCSACHPAEIVAGKEHSREEWERVVEEMSNAGAVATEDEFQSIIEYLARNFPKLPPGKVNVNRSSAASLATGLEITAKQADSIVHYREQNGSFKAVEDLKKVPGLDFKKVEAQKDKLVF